MNMKHSNLLKVLAYFDRTANPPELLSDLTKGVGENDNWQKKTYREEADEHFKFLDKMDKLIEEQNKNQIWIWHWKDENGSYHGWNYDKAATREEALAKARHKAKKMNLQVDEASLHKGDDEEVQSYFRDSL
jgi:hypothetical protein